MKWVITAAVAALGISVPGASAAEWRPAAQRPALVQPDGSAAPERYQRWLTQMVAPAPSGPIALILDNCPDPDRHIACAIPGAIWFSPTWGRATFLHEMGHQFDYRMPASARDHFRSIMRDPRPWRTAPNSPHEQFAAAYAMCAWPTLARRSYNWDSGRFDEAEYGYAPTRRQQRAVCHLVRSSGG